MLPDLLWAPPAPHSALLLEEVVDGALSSAEIGFNVVTHVANLAGAAVVADADARAPSLPCGTL